MSVNFASGFFSTMPGLSRCTNSMYDDSGRFGPSLPAPFFRFFPPRDFDGESGAPDPDTPTTTPTPAPPLRRPFVSSAKVHESNQSQSKPKEDAKSEHAVLAPHDLHDLATACRLSSKTASIP